jgi:AraC-like DNA-binding protein
MAANGVDHTCPADLQAVASSILVPLRVTAPAGRPFRARLTAAVAGPLVAARIRGTAHVVSRQARSITSSDPGLLKVTFHRRGMAMVAQDGRENRVKPGDLVVVDTARPYHLAVDDLCDVVVIGVPRSFLGVQGDLISRRSATPLEAGSGTRAVVAATMSGLGDHIDGLPGPAGRHLGDALTSLLIAAFTETAAERADVASDLTERIIAYALANLADPTLSVASVARHHGISTSRLHQLFRRRGHTFAAWVRHERLRRIQRDLLDPDLAQQTAAAIATRWGIADPRHLGRALKAEFGHTAAELRRAPASL